MRVLIDADCPLCQALGRGLKALDLRGTLRVEALQEARDLPQVELLQALHVLEGDRVHRGYAALLALGRRLPLLWPLYPFLLLGRVGGLGERLYAALAQRRRRA
ncbi:DCC1-like thiol-disulfide oxidoreductase family protein [Thermus sp. FJN-A]